MPNDFVDNSLVTRADYVRALTMDKGQFLTDGMMPSGGPENVLAVEKLAGLVKKPVDLGVTYTNEFAIKANKLQGFTITRQ